MAENKVIIDGKDREKENDYILQVNHLTKLYGASNKAEAAKLMKEGKTKDEVFKETGVTVALWDVSFKVKRGEVFVIIGLSGSGKSTLLHIIGGVDVPTGGKVYLDGQDVYAQNNEKLAIFRRRQVGLIYQFHNLIPTLNVVENITLPVLMDRRKVNEERLNELLEMLGLDLVLALDRCYFLAFTGNA